LPHSTINLDLFSSICSNKLKLLINISLGGIFTAIEFLANLYDRTPAILIA